MAVISCIRKTGTRTRTIGKDWKRTYSVEFLAVCDTQYTGPWEVAAACPVQFGALYKHTDDTGTVTEHDYGVFANTITVSEDPECDDGTQYLIRVEYSAYDPTDFPQNPLSWPSKLSFGFVKMDRPVLYDNQGNAIVNSAGDYFFDPPVRIDDSRPVLRLVRNEENYDPGVASLYKDAVNSDIFMGQQERTWKVSNIQGDLHFDPDCGTVDGFYYEVSYEIEYNPDTWDVQVLDQGTRQFYGSYSRPVEIKDDQGQPVSSPVPLNGAGARLAANGTPVFKKFRVYKELPFANLNLETNGAPGGWTS